MPVTSDVGGRQDSLFRRWARVQPPPHSTIIRTLAEKDPTHPASASLLAFALCPGNWPWVWTIGVSNCMDRPCPLLAIPCGDSRTNGMAIETVSLENYGKAAAMECKVYRCTLRTYMVISLADERANHRGSAVPFRQFLDRVRFGPFLQLLDLLWFGPFPETNS